MKARHLGPGGVVAVSLLLALLITGLTRGELPLHSLELRSLDRFFRLRHRLQGPLPIDPRLVFIGVDDSTFEAVGKPHLLWLPEYTRAIATLLEGGASVVGYDFIFNPIDVASTSLEPDHFLLQSLDEADLELGQLVMAEPVVMAELLDPEGLGKQTFGPMALTQTLAFRPDALFAVRAELEPVAGPNVAAVNVLHDQDGVTRRVAATFYLERDQDWAAGATRTLALRMVELATGAPFRLRDGEVYWGELPIPTDENLGIRLNYPGPAGERSAFRYLSMSELFQPDFDAEIVRDKICLIGPASASLQDYKATPYEPETFGPEVHLALLNTLLTRSFIVAPGGLWLALNLTLACMAGLLALFQTRERALLTTSALVVGYLVMAVAAFVSTNLWLPVVSSLASLGAGWVTGYTERLLTIEKERAQLRSTFGRMVSEQVMKHVLDKSFDLQDGSERVVTVLFSDINHFTPTCERHTPREIIAMLSSYFELMVDVILRYDGYIKQYVGDEIMVIFGAPDDQEDHAEKAVRCGVEMLEVLKAAEASATGPGFYDIKIGINTGPVVVGRVGPEKRWEYAAVGDDVNLGARVMSITKNLDTKMLVSQNTYLACRDATADLDWTSRGVQQFKGKTAEMEVYEVRRET